MFQSVPKLQELLTCALSSHSLSFEIPFITVAVLNNQDKYLNEFFFL